jgi:hypothetical protein
MKKKPKPTPPAKTRKPLRVSRPPKKGPVPRVPKGGLKPAQAEPAPTEPAQATAPPLALAPGWTLPGLLQALGQTHRQYDGSYFAACPLDATHTLTVTPEGGLVCGAHPAAGLWAVLEGRRA